MAIQIPNEIVTIEARPNMIIPFRTRRARAAPPPADKTQRRYPAMVWWLVGYALLMGTAISSFTYLPLYAQERLDLTPTWAGLLTVLVSVTAVMARILWSRSAEAMVHYSGPLGLIAAAGSVGVLLILVAPEIGWPVLVVGVVLAGSLSGWNPLALLGIIRDAPAVSASASGALLFGMAAGGSIGAPLFGFSVDRTGSYVTGWIATALVLMMAATVARMWARSAGLATPNRGQQPAS